MTVSTNDRFVDGRWFLLGNVAGSPKPSTIYETVIRRDGHSSRQSFVGRSVFLVVFFSGAGLLLFGRNRDNHAAVTQDALLLVI